MTPVAIASHILATNYAEGWEGKGMGMEGNGKTNRILARIPHFALPHLTFISAAYSCFCGEGRAHIALN